MLICNKVLGIKNQSRKGDTGMDISYVVYSIISVGEIYLEHIVKGKTNYIILLNLSLK